MLQIINMIPQPGNLPLGGVAILPTIKSESARYSIHMKYHTEPRHKKTGFLHMRLFVYAKTQLISAFVFATQIIQSLFFLNPKFQGSSHLLWLYSLVCVGNPEDWFSHNEGHTDPKFSNRQVYANSADPDQTAPRDAV